MIRVFPRALALAFVGLSSLAHAGELPVEKAILTSPPEVPPVIERSHPAKVIVELEVIEKVMKMADGTDYLFWTYGGTVPGRFIRVREGDVVEFHLKNNPKNKLPHNIDLHAVTGPGGGAASTFTAPGHQTRFTFTALNPGLFIYHCATAPVGMHIGNGMYGLIYVQPKDPLPKVDHEYYVVQGDFYTAKPYGAKGLQQFSMERAIDEKPTYVVFNGAVNSLTGDNALKAKVGEKIRLFVGNGGPNLVSSFHVIGEIFDKVYTEGGAKVQENVQTTLIPSGGSTIVEYKVDVPGTYILVDHSIFRTFNKGSLGMMKVEGPEDKMVYSGKEVDEVYLGDEIVASNVKGGSDKPTTPPAASTAKASGKELFEKNCAMCHQAQGQGLPGVFPPLAKSDFLKKITDRADRREWVEFILKGKQGKVTVNGVDYNGIMTPVSGLSDDELATLMTFVSNSWGNKAREFTPAEVKKYREAVEKGGPAPASAH